MHELSASLMLLITRPSSGNPFFDFFMFTKLKFFLIMSSSSLISISIGFFPELLFHGTYQLQHYLETSAVEMAVMQIGIMEMEMEKEMLQLVGSENN